MARKTIGAANLLESLICSDPSKPSSVRMSNGRGDQPMADEPLPQVADVEHLTDVLRRSGMLGNGRVVGVQVESSRPQLVSRVIRLRLSYDRAVDAPSSLILKVGIAKRHDDVWETGRREVEFYTRLAPMMSVHLVPRCFDAAFYTDTKAWHLLLEDLTDTHAVATQWPLPPSTGECKRMLRALARFHATWWDDHRLGASAGAWPDDNALAEVLRKFAKFYESFADRLGDLLSPQRREIYERFMDSAPGHLARFVTRRNLSIIHGDAHAWNYLMPRDGGDDVRLFDWDNWRIGFVANDLAYMMATHWYPERRHRFERPLLDYYHEALVATGVRGYGREALDEDYRLAVVWQLMTPVWQAAMDIPPWVWWGHLERIMLAIDDLGCGSLIR